MALLDATGWVANFKQKPLTEGGHAYTSDQELIAWQERDDGTVVGLVLEDKKLRAANTFSNFFGYARASDRGWAVIAAQSGWWEVWRSSKQPHRANWFRIIAWLVEPEGFGLKAISTPGLDGITEPDDPDETCVFIYDLARQSEGDGPWPWPDDKGTDLP